MNWQHFLSWLAGLYLLYYLMLILFDVSKGGSSQPAVSNELTFSEDIIPQKIEHLPDKPDTVAAQAPKTASPIIGSGGVSLKNLFGLCREEAIIYTRPVSF